MDRGNKNEKSRLFSVTKLLVILFIAIFLPRFFLKNVPDKKNSVHDKTLLASAGLLKKARMLKDKIKQSFIKTLTVS